MDFSKEELQDMIIVLMDQLHTIQCSAEMNNVLDSRLINVKTALDKMRRRLGEYNVIRD